MRVEIQQIAGPVPVKRQGAVEVASLPADTRAVVQHAIDAVRTHARESPKAPTVRRRGTAPVPDVGSSIVTIDSSGMPAASIR